MLQQKIRTARATDSCYGSLSKSYSKISLGITLQSLHSLLLFDHLHSLKKETRTALLASKRNMDAMSISNREELLRSSAILEKKDPNEKVTFVLYLQSIRESYIVMV